MASDNGGLRGDRRVRVVFLDIDGVLNSVGTYKFFQKQYKEGDEIPDIKDELCLISMSNLNCILKQVPDCKIVISSTWRKTYPLEELIEMFKKYGYEWPIIGVTPSLRRKLSEMADRGDEIRSWLKDNPGVEQHVAIDDNYVSLPEANFVQTDCRDGLVYSKAQEAMEKLGFPDKGVYLF